MPPHFLDHLLAEEESPASASLIEHLDALRQSLSELDFGGTSYSQDDTQIDQDPPPNLLHDYFAHGGVPTTSKQPADSNIAANLANLQINDAPLAGSSQTATNWLASVLPPSASLEKTMAILTSSANNDSIAESLLEIFGFELIEMVEEAIKRRSDIVAEAAQQDEQAIATLAPESAPAPVMRQISKKQQNVAVKAQPQERIHVPVSQIRFKAGQKHESQKVRKQAQKEFEEHRLAALHEEENRAQGMSWEQMAYIREEQLQAAANRPLVIGNGAVVQDRPQYKHVYVTESKTLSFFGQISALPFGSKRDEREHYSEITIPPPQQQPMRATEKFVKISELDKLCQGSFPGYKTLNRLQSIVYPTGYKTNENMLVCAPTGAGKTDVAMLTILRAISQYGDLVENADGSMSMRSSDFKVVYVAPMKALAAEIVRKMSSRLAWIGYHVRELTGDMQLTRQQIADTHMIVTTPEKWDVVTRKNTGEGELSSKVKLLIIDEVHLLHEDRGAVLETIVARTLRQVESLQSLIRIVGLSATLPNYLDVADFLGVNRNNGLFYFDGSFRPVPLEQHFLAAKGKSGSPQSKENMDRATFDKVAELVLQGHQVLVFVHARKETVKTAQMLRDSAMREGLPDLFDPSTNNKFEMFKKQAATSPNREMKELLQIGLGIHHAGMLRSDRNLSEKMFEANVTKVLVCTATLAWGVNLPAYAVIIKNTQLYDSAKGSFMDLSILDVLQMWGRAGRPQYEDRGVAYICTTVDKLDHYVRQVMQQFPIESKFTEGLTDSLNAEIALGTVSTIDEGVKWLGYTFLYVRMRVNCMAYGMSHKELEDDPYLGSKRHKLITVAAHRLVEAGMIRFDESTGAFTSTEVGRIASRYYLRHASVEIFNTEFRPVMSEADALHLLASSVEFQQLALRESESDELKFLMERKIPCQVKGGLDSATGKANILLQAYIGRAAINDFALVSDTEYVATNAARIGRALLELAISRCWSSATEAILRICKAIERRMWPDEHMFHQFKIPPNIVNHVERWAGEWNVEDIAKHDPENFGRILHLNEHAGLIAVNAARQMPFLDITTTVQPLAHGLIRVRVKMSRAFEWSEKTHGQSEFFWVWLSDEDNLDILQLHRVAIRVRVTVIYKDFIIPMAVIPRRIYVRVASDRWIGSDESFDTPLTNLVMPPVPGPTTQILQIPLYLLSDSADPELISLFPGRTSLDATQTQCFHTIYHTRSDAMICAPSSSNRDALAEMAILRAFKQQPQSIVLVIVPRVSLVTHRAHSLRNRLGRILDINVLAMTKRQESKLPIWKSPASIIVTSPFVLESLPAAHHILSQHLDLISLVVATDLHSLDAAYESSMTVLRASATGARFVGFSSSLLDDKDLAGWLRVPPIHAYSFHPSTRSTPIVTNIVPFTIPHSAALLKSMMKPAYTAMRNQDGPVIIFTPAVPQCFSTAADLITQCAADLSAGAFIGMSEASLHRHAQKLSSPRMAESLMHGFAIYHDNMPYHERNTVLNLYQSGGVRVLICPRDACWSLRLQASLVIVLSTQYAVLGMRGEREVMDYNLAELLQMQGFAQGIQKTEGAEVLIMTQMDQADLYSRYITHGSSLESSMVDSPVLRRRILHEIFSGAIKARQGVVDWLSWSFLARRIISNPNYYSVDPNLPPSDRMSDIVDRVTIFLRNCALIRIRDGNRLTCTLFGQSVLENSYPMSVVEAIMGMNVKDAIEVLELEELEISSDESAAEGDDESGSESGSDAESKGEQEVEDADEKPAEAQAEESASEAQADLPQSIPEPQATPTQAETPTSEQEVREEVQESSDHEDLPVPDENIAHPDQAKPHQEDYGGESTEESEDEHVAHRATTNELPRDWADMVEDEEDFLPDLKDWGYDVQNFDRTPIVQETRSLNWADLDENNEDYLPDLHEWGYEIPPPPEHEEVDEEDADGKGKTPTSAVEQVRTDSSVEAFFSTLPRSLQRSIQVEDWSQATWYTKAEGRRRMLLVALLNGRVPLDPILEKEQKDMGDALVKGMLKRNSRT